MLTVRDVMTRPVKTVGPDMPLKEVARLLIDSGVSGAPVVDLRGEVLGVVSEADFLIKEQGAQAIHHRRDPSARCERCFVRDKGDIHGRLGLVTRVVILKPIQQ